MAKTMLLYALAVVALLVAAQFAGDQVAEVYRHITEELIAR